MFSLSAGETLSGELSAEELILEALVASGIEESETGSYITRISGLKENFLSLIEESDSLGAAEKALDFLYENLLVRYESGQTTISGIFDDGTYNCVSSTIMYLYLMKIAGVPCTAVQTPHHAFCEVKPVDKTIRVETTNPYGFNPGTKKESEIPNQYFVVPAKYYGGKKPVSDRTAVLMIYQNRISDLQKKGNHALPYPLAEQCFARLGSFPQSLDLVQNTAANIIADYSSAKALDEGIAFARETYRKYGFSKNGQTNTEGLIKQKVWQFEDSLDYHSACEFLEEQKELLGEQKARDLMKTTFTNLLNRDYDLNGYDSALENSRLDFIRKYLSEKELSRITDNFTDMECAGIHNRFVIPYNHRDYKNALKILQEGMEKYGQNRILVTDFRNAVQAQMAGIYEASGYEKALEYLSSGIVMKWLPEDMLNSFRNQVKKMESNRYHNLAAVQVNSKNYEAARVIIDEGLEKLGNDKALLNDSARLKKIGY